MFLIIVTHVKGEMDVRNNNRKITPAPIYLDIIVQSLEIGQIAPVVVTWATATPPPINNIICKITSDWGGNKHWPCAHHK